MNPTSGAADRIREAALRMVHDATLDDLASFVTATRLAAEAGVSPSTLQALFPPEAAGGGRVRTTAQAAMRSAVVGPAFDGRPVATVVEGFLTGLEDAAGSGRSRPSVSELFDGLARLAADYATGPLTVEYNREFLAAAAAGADDVLRLDAAEWHRTVLAEWAAVAERLCQLTGRSLVEGVTPEAVALAFVMAFDGAVLNLRMVRGAEPEGVRRLFEAIWGGLTRRPDDLDDLLAHRVAVLSDQPFGPSELDAVTGAVRRLNDRVGWGGVTLRKVGQLSGLPPGRLAEVAPDRDHLAGIAWVDVCHDVSRACPRGTPVDEVARALVDAVCSHRALVGSLLRAGLAPGGPPSWWPVPGRGAGPLIDALTDATGGPPGEAAAVVVDAVLLGAAHDAPRPVLEQVVTGLLGDGAPGGGSGGGGGGGGGGGVRQ